MRITPVQEPEQRLRCIPDISTLLRIGHFYFALTVLHFFLAVHRDRRYDDKKERKYGGVYRVASMDIEGELQACLHS
jgi:hypothetical protein